MVIIYSASSDSKSAEHSSRILAPLIHWLAPSLSENSVAKNSFFLSGNARM
jgi:hypothetical protein